MECIKCCESDGQGNPSNSACSICVQEKEVSVFESLERLRKIIKMTKKHVLLKKYRGEAFEIIDNISKNLGGKNYEKNE